MMKNYENPIRSMNPLLQREALTKSAGDCTMPPMGMTTLDCEQKSHL